MSASEFVHVAESYIGYCEYPPNSNRTRFGEWFGMDGKPWCDMFVSYCGAMSDESEAVGVFSGCIAHVEFFESVGVWHRNDFEYVPAYGDIVFFAYSNGVPCHVGIVTGYADDGTVYTIEGNTSSSSDDNGGTVARRERFLYETTGFHIIGFAKPNFGGGYMLSDDDIRRIRDVVREVVYEEMPNWMWGFEDRYGSSAINEIANIKARVDSNGVKLDALQDRFDETGSVSNV